MADSCTARVPRRYYRVHGLAFGPLALLRSRGGSLNIDCPGSFICDWLRCSICNLLGRLHLGTTFSRGHTFPGSDQSAGKHKVSLMLLQVRHPAYGQRAMRGSKTDAPARPLPVHGVTGCVGHLLYSARGFRAFDAHDKEIGLYPTPDAGVAALLELATAAD